MTPKWKRRAGACLGLREANLEGVVTLGGAFAQLLPKIEVALASILDEPLPVMPQDQGAAQRIATLYAFAHGAIQRQSRIALTQAVYVCMLDGTSLASPEFTVYVPTAGQRPSRIALEWAGRLFNRVAAGQVLQALDEREVIHASLMPFANPGLNYFNVVSAAHELDVPVQSVVLATIVLGTGSRSRWMESSLTDATPAIAMRIANSKLATATVLRNAGLPGGNNMLVTSPEQAVEVARKLGYPVVVKPVDLQQGTGVSADLRNDASVVHGFEVARAASPNVLVEKWAPGFTHRLTVFNGKVIRVTRRIAGGVFGDGENTIAALVGQQQQSEMLQRGLRRLGRMLIELDDEALDLLRQNGQSIDSVPRSGEYVRLRRRDNVSAGGTNEHVALHETHTDNLQLAIDATARLRLDFAGVDLIIEDITQSWLATGALICEVNGQPQLGTRSDPKIYLNILRELLGEDCRIPARLFICADDETRRQLAVESLLRDGKSNGFASQAGLWIDGRLATGPFPNGFAAAQALLRRSDVHDAMCLMTIDEVTKMGLPLSQWDRIEIVDRSWLTAQDEALVSRVSEMIGPHQMNVDRR
ncbi:MAG: cyanophycin synthetase [Ramlibacter sp.]|nr:cyanophycin synthetase [Ramlibacter sp.]